jgi:PAS domain S-box-containing protein
MGRERNDPLERRAPSWAIRAIRAQGASSLGGGLLTVAVLLALSWLVSYLLGGAGHVPPHWFYIPILLAAARFGLPGAAAAGLAAGLLAGPLLPADVATHTAQPLADWLGRLGFFVGIGLVMGAVTVGLTSALEREIDLARDAADLALRQGEQRTRSILETANEAVVGMDARGAITDWNRAAEATFGWSREEAIGRILVDTLVPERHREAHRKGFKRFLATGEGPILNTRIELEALHRDGHELPIELTVSALQAGGSPTFIAFVHDITERRKAEEALRASEASLRDVLEAKYRALVEKLPAIVYEAEFGEHGAWRYVSPQIEQMLGFTPERWMAEPALWWERLHPDDRPRAIADEARSRRTGEALRSEYRMVGEDGRVVWFRDEATVVRDEEDRPLFMQGLMFDVSDEKRAEEELRLVNAELERRVLDRTSQLDAANQELVERQERLSEARLEAERANRAKSEFLSRMSHELRTPLNAILGFGQLLDMDELTEHQEEAVRQILKGGGHLLDLINEVLDIARIEVGRMQLSLEPVAVNELVGDAAGLVRPLADQRRVRIEVALADGDPYVVADRQRLQQVLLNLLSNAVKYNREGGSVRCSTRSVGTERLRIDVSDDGMGIPKEEFERLFVPFERLGVEKTGVEGTGLGLALSKQLVDAMEGTLGVESAPGRGSTFTVELPLGAAPVSSWTTGAAERSERPGPTAGIRTVLCIDDNLSHLKVIERLVAYRPEIRLLSALSGSLGVDLARTHRPDAILLDIGLPDTSGHDVLRRLRAEPSTNGIPVIVVSANASDRAMASLLAAGARAHVTKPVDVRRLRGLLDDLLFGVGHDEPVKSATGATDGGKPGGEA